MVHLYEMGDREYRARAPVEAKRARGILPTRAIVSALILGMAGIYAADGAGLFGQAQPDSVTVQPVDLGLCAEADGRDCVSDGGLLLIGGRKLMISDVDVPSASGAKCAAQKRIAEKAAARIVALTRGNSLEIIPQPFDGADGLERIALMAGGRNVGQTLVAEGLSRSWEEDAHWCPSTGA